MNEAIRDNRLSTADLVARAERPDDDRIEREAFDERRADERTGEDIADRMGEPVATHAAGTRIDERVARAVPAGQPDDEPPMELFAAAAAEDFRARWDAVQIGFVDDPERAVRQADELVAQVMSSLAETFATQRSELERYVTGDTTASTERMRVALRRYRSFFQRLLTL